MDLSLPTLSYAAAVVLFAYFIRGIAGFGSALIAVPLLALRLPLAVVVPLIALLDYVASLTQGIQNRSHIRWREIWPLLPFTVLGVATGLLLHRLINPALLTKALGVFIGGYAIYALLPLPNLSGRRWWAVPAGYCGGTVGALFGTGGPFYVIYLTLRQADKFGFRATAATIFLFDGGCRLIGFTLSGMFHRLSLLAAVGALPLVAVGLRFGNRIHLTITPKNFMRLVCLILLGSGIMLLLK
ncbi:MAG: sulfite exporter TauE/SafE family protein [Thermodesulfobacteriota bacterium]